MTKKVNLQEKRIIVTGGSLGIGRACAEACLEAGAHVLICARNAESLEKTLKKFHSKGFKNISAKISDISQEDQAASLFETAVGQWGGLDGLIHAAGIYGSIGTVTDVDPKVWLETIKVNLFGTFLVARHACRAMKQTGGGRLVFFSGGGASTPFPNYTAYACSKVAVVRFTETLAQEMAPYNIEANCLAPGFVVTRLHQETLAAKNALSPEFIRKTKQQIEEGGVSPSVPAGAASFFISDEAKGITGKFIAAAYDSWKEWPEHLIDLQKSDIFTLRRILPTERGMNW